jgi:4'-phosphopantetheinyl transferase
LNVNLSPSSPANYAMRAGELHVWKAPLASTLTAIADPAALLSDAERERAGRFAFEKDQAHYISCRTALRLLLGRYTGVPPDKIVFRYEPHGKPALAGVPGWQFNVSHSRDLAAIAISRYDAVGIDVERIDLDFPRGEVASEILAPDEIRDLAALDAGAQPAYFFQLWTLKEALLKAVGCGFSLDPRDIRIRLDEALNPEIISAPPDFIHATLRRFTLDPGYAAALAVLARVSEVAFFSL